MWGMYLILCPQDVFCLLLLRAGDAQGSPFLAGGFHAVRLTDSLGHGFVAYWKWLQHPPSCFGAVTHCHFRW